MADRKDVIKGLECCASGSCMWCTYFRKHHCLTTLEKDALEMLKEQEPKRVVITTDSYGTKFYHCPRCSHNLYAYPRQLYCSQCGQAVKWDA